MAYEGRFEDICIVFAVTEGVYMDWGQHLADAGSELGNDFYGEWITLHREVVLGPFVRFVESVVDAVPESGLKRLSNVFKRTLQYENRFWNMAYSGETW